MKEQKHSICYMILPEGIREDLEDGLEALSEKLAKDKRMATVGEKVVALARVCPAGTHMEAVSIGRVITTERSKGYGKQIMLP